MQRSIDDLEILNQFLQAGKVVLCPSDTIWGLSCDALNAQAVQRIFEIKERDPAKKLILLVDSIDQLKEYVDSLHPRIETLIYFCDRPLTIIYKAGTKLPDYLVSADGTVAVRVVKKGYMKEAINMLGNPVVSTSANVQGRPTPATYEEVEEIIRDRVDYVSAFGRNTSPDSRPSVIIKYNEDGELIFLR